MKLPKSIELLGREIFIIETDEIIFEGEKAEGLYEHENRRMLIVKDQKDWEKIECTIHESAHSYCTQLGIDQCLPRWAIECICQVMTMFAMDIIKGLSKPQKRTSKK